MRLIIYGVKSELERLQTREQLGANAAKCFTITKSLQLEILLTAAAVVLIVRLCCHQMKRKWKDWKQRVFYVGGNFQSTVSDTDGRGRLVRQCETQRAVTKCLYLKTWHEIRLN